MWSCLARTWKSAEGLLEEEAACSTFSEAYSLWESMTAALPWAYRSPYTLAFPSLWWLLHTHTHTHTYIHACKHTAMHACFHTLWLCAPLPHPPPGLIPGAPENAAAMMSPAVALASKAPKDLSGTCTKSTRNLTLPSLSSMCFNSNSPLQKVHTHRWENYTGNSKMRYSRVLAVHWGSLGTSLITVPSVRCMKEIALVG